MKLSATFVIAVVVALSLALASAAGAQPGSPGACRLLKVSEIKSEFGPNVGKGDKGAGSTCSWPVGDPGVAGSGTVSTLLYRGASASTAYESGRTSYPDAASVTGLGKEAFFAPGLGVLWVLKSKKTSFYVQGVFIADGLSNTGVPDLEAKLNALAKIAMKRA